MDSERPRDLTHADVDGSHGSAPEKISRFAEALASARRSGRPLSLLPEVDVTLSFDEAKAVQREVGRRLGLDVAGWKAGLIPGVRFTCAAVYGSDVLESPAVYRLPCVPAVGEATAFVEGEVAFSLAHDLPPRAQPYSDEEVAQAVDCCHAAIEIGNPRLVHFDAAPLTHKLADSMGNGAIIWGGGSSGWRAVDWSALRIRMMLDGKTVVDHLDGAKGADPLATLVALVNTRNREPLRARQVVITGNRTGFNVAKPGTRIHVVIDGLGDVSVQIAE
jgi:2-keto-4-pentenoate hydratase